ncbi:response regulator [Desertibaculum subflavum]|uniref:response regulator n=1 Tax=Desertibaculum subflavum TaxID=2268458 RepID=UPI0034D28E7C
MSYYSFENLSFLLVDDNEPMRRLVRTILHQLGSHDIVEAPEGEEALDLLRGQAVDIVVCDMMMRPMDGIAFTHAVRQDGRSPNRFLPIIMTSAYSEPDKVVAARDAGVTEFLAKPLSVTALYQRVMAVVERPRPFVRNGAYFGPLRRGIDAGPNIPRGGAGVGTLEMLDG